MAKPIVIAHRGASGYLPEHTLAAKLLAFEQGADYLEQDIVLSKDGVAIVLHDVYLDTVSNIAALFPARNRSDGRYYALDFTFAELQTLRLSERFHHATGEAVYPNRYPVGFGDFKIVSLQEELEFIANLRGPVGIYPEIKAPRWHRDQGYDITKTVLAILKDFGYTNADQAIYLQCFDAAELQRIRFDFGCQLPLIQLLADATWAHPHEQVLTDLNDLETIAEYADGIGPWLPLAVTSNHDTFSSTGLIEAAHQKGLKVHPYTLRTDDVPEGAKIGCNDAYIGLLDTLFKTAQADGAFTDFPDVLRSYLDDVFNKQN